MAGGFAVDLGALEKAAEGVNNTLDELAAKKVKDINTNEGALGHNDLAGTVADFCDRWEIGVEHLAKDGQEVAARLTQSVAEYVKMDKSLKGHLDGVLRRSSGDDPGAH
ncbi:hypothetical protein [Amycolatopsis sp. PS_44_ISF1]|uniref:hypothetical protein n=1 Tax=Amycolatopsis sp. PS_44_ISF1 TaxID=2974917 RepID=UPI0028DDB04C|nr:hypothetical protein [Amycolatopsis sp. PS_44_ISF1]MDT8913754.1 hypothetical protein [Amycolatopsis sp. PS_44_ISF1]